MRDFFMEISDDKKNILNELKPGKAVLIEGDAGTGKTLMGILCGQTLLQYTSPWQRCLFLTFSKLAKRQISECIQKTIKGNVLDPDLAARMDVLNYHSLWWHLIAKQYSFLEISREPILCTYDEKRKLAVEAMKELPPSIIPKAFLTTRNNINRQKEKDLLDTISGMAVVYAEWGAENFGRTADEFIGCRTFLLWSKDKILEWNRQGLFSHAETVYWAYSLLKNHPNELLWMRETYPIMVIDEFQDTDAAQWDIVQLMSPKTLIAMADTAQTIHMWRGADPKRLEKFAHFGQAVYLSHQTNKLYNRHRSLKIMSDHRNITWQPLKDAADPNNAAQMNLVKKQAKVFCKKKVRDIKRSGGTVGILCLTNNMADEITWFLRSRQTFVKGGYDPEIPCARLGVDNSPLESARKCVLSLLEQSASTRTIGAQDFLANSILKELLPCKLNVCSARSISGELKRRWEWAGSIAKTLEEDFGSALRQMAEFIIAQARSTNCFCDFQITGCLKHVGDTICRIGKAWKELTSEGKRKKIDAAVLQYENALSNSRLAAQVSVMTIHQSKGREFSTVVVPWFTSIPWSPDEPGWKTSTLDHQRLFHTACTRAKDEAIVIFPKGQQALWPVVGKTDVCG